MAKSSTPLGGGGAVDARADFQMPTPGSLVIWFAAPGGDACVAAVTKIGRRAISVMLFPPDSRVGQPKDSVRHVDDPWNKIYDINPDSGVWDFTPEHKLLLSVVGKTNV